MSKSFTVAEVAMFLRTDQGKILAWIKSGELIAVNIARSTAKSRPRWRIMEEDFQAFRAARVSTAAEVAHA